MKLGLIKFMYNTMKGNFGGMGLFFVFFFFLFSWGGFDIFLLILCRIQFAVRKINIKIFKNIFTIVATTKKNLTFFVPFCKNNFWI